MISVGEDELKAALRRAGSPGRKMTILKRITRFKVIP